MNVLVYVVGTENAGHGGPVGYVSKLKKGVKENSNSEGISFYFDSGRNSLSLWLKLLRFFYYILRRFSKKKLFSYRVEREKNLVAPCSFDSLDRILSEKSFDYIHLHRVTEVIALLPLIEKYELKVILTLHNPVPPSQEKLPGWNQAYSQALSLKLLKEIQAMENQALKLSNSLFFPCEEAIQSYYKNWEGFEELINGKDVHYFLTGTQEQSVTKHQDDIRQELGLENKIVIGFFGRHHPVKGYDLLKDVAKELLSKREDVVFLIAGKEFPLQGLSHPRWIEYGWTSEVGSLQNASDIIVLPNRETYFDLGLLEVMSLGKPVLASNTGGNDKVKSMSEGIVLFDIEREDDFLMKLNELVECSNLSELGQYNKSAYEQYFTLNKFARGYCDLIKELK